MTLPRKHRAPTFPWLSIPGLFRLDAAGAALSVLLLGGVLPSVSSWLGVSRAVLYGLALWAVGCLLFDLFCLWRTDADHRRLLRCIMAMNTLYCVLTIALMIGHADVLTPWGFAYFIAEIPVILGLVAVEWQVYRRTGASPAPPSG